MKILLIVLLIAVAVYGTTRLLEKGLSRRRHRNQPPQPIAPDDDLDFLRNLDWEQRKDRQRRRKDADGTEEPESDEGTDETPGETPSS